MSLLGCALVLLAACCHAIWNFCVKKLNSGPELIWLFSFCSIAIYLPVAVAIFISNPIVIDLRTSIFVVGSVMLLLVISFFFNMDTVKGICLLCTRLQEPLVRYFLPRLQF